MTLVEGLAPAEFRPGPGPRSAWRVRRVAAYAEERHDWWEDGSCGRASNRPRERWGSHPHALVEAVTRVGFDPTGGAYVGGDPRTAESHFAVLVLPIRRHIDFSCIGKGTWPGFNGLEE
ncbi:DUF6461 domain-containing protein [Streptomyces sp. NPDC059477]|uniref:DUF6461 domain-containing protein n=1 Tax=Streptomyces sp. NPDC059477 TaxID=3346847 RepID=UPI0036A7A1F2